METITGIMETREVFIDGKPLSPGESQKIIDHSPDGFCWGYGGSGPAQLALAILLKFTDRETACNLYQKFKWDMIATLPQGDFVLSIEGVKSWIENHKSVSV